MNGSSSRPGGKKAERSGHATTMYTLPTETMNEHAAEQRPPEFRGGRRGSTRGAFPVNRGGATTQVKKDELPRAASYTYLPTTISHRLRDSHAVDFDIISKTRYVTGHSEGSEDVLAPEVSSANSSDWSTPDEEARNSALPKAQDLTTQLRRSFSSARNDTPVQSARNSAESSSQHVPNGAPPFLTDHLSANRAFGNPFKRRSWNSTASTVPSRSPSPPKKNALTRSHTIGAEVSPGLETEIVGRKKSLLSRRLSSRSTKHGKAQKENKQSGCDLESDKPITRRGTFLRRKSSSRDISIVKPGDRGATKAQDLKDALPAVPAIPKSFSTDKLPMVRSMTSLTLHATPSPKLLSTDRFHHNNPSSSPKKKDELWSVFRTLDADFAKFSSKPSTLKANVVRSSLIPFLRSYESHASNETLRIEDLDRRCNILNKWWTGLIDLLYGRNNQSISGTDRPAILDGVLGLMERPEWRRYPSPFCSLRERCKATLANASSSHTSLGSSSSDFLTDAVHHNVRNIFIQNLSSQMAFVVEKMSSRHASASLVNFCGKACAYAFMFVPGMADVLIRLWDLPVDTIRRVLKEHGVGKFESLSTSTADLASDFPPALHHLGFTSLTNCMRTLRTPPPLPIGTNHLDWWGHWLDRWSGRESDLFYVFVKQYHVLVTNFLPSDTTKMERLAVPGLLLVHAQILSNLDATIHRDTSQAQQDSTLGGPLATFDELLGDPDAIASALPLSPINATRHMAENRIVMLVRDFLSERTTQHPMAQDFFAESFNHLLHAAVRSTSLYNYSACYTLLDFLEESLLILVRYSQTRESGAPQVDMEFWQTVWRKMMDSENTMTEIRLYAFLYTVWNTVICDSGSKMQVCKHLLLDNDVFESRFNHWCPMVRAYYMRLLCWRVARHDSDEDGAELNLLTMMHERLMNTWSGYLFLRQEADSEHKLRPATNPCHPAPGRRMLIVRTDNLVHNAASFMTLDGLFKDSPLQMAKPAWKRTGSTSILDEIGSRPASSSSSYADSEIEAPQKGIGGFFRRIMGKSRPLEATHKTTTTTRQGSDSSGSTLEAVARGAADDGHSTAPPSPQHRMSSFRFSMEFHANIKQLPPMRLSPPRLPAPAQLFLLAKCDKAQLAEQSMRATQPIGSSVARARYSGRALAEWAMVIGECHSFFERRKNEGAPSNKHVETPALAVEVFKRTT